MKKMREKIPILTISMLFALFAYTILTTPWVTPPDYTPPLIPHAVRTVGSVLNYPAMWTGFWVIKKCEATSLPAVVSIFLICFAAWGCIVYFGLKKGIALTKS